MSDIDAFVETVRRVIRDPGDEWDELRQRYGRASLVDALEALAELAALARQQSAADAMWRAENDRARGAEIERDRLKVALREVLDCKGPYNGTVSGQGGYPALCCKCEEIARAALADEADA